MFFPGKNISPASVVFSFVFCLVVLFFSFCCFSFLLDFEAGCSNERLLGRSELQGIFLSAQHPSCTAYFLGRRQNNFGAFCWLLGL